MTNDRFLFVCGKARKRSPTAADLIFKETGIETRCGGTSKDADEPVALEDINWATHIYCMEKNHRTKLQALFGSALRSKPITVLAIPDTFEYMEQNLVNRLSRKFGLKP